MADWFKPAETAGHPDPFPWYERARREGRIIYVPENDWYVVTRHREILEVLRDAVSYSNATSVGEPKPIPAEILQEAGEDWNPRRIGPLTTTDPPRHTRLRKLLAPSFTPRRIGEFEALIRQVAEARIDAIADRGKGDLGSEFAFGIPTRIIARIMGADEESAGRFVEWGDALTAVFFSEASEERQLWGWRMLVEQDAFVRELIEARRGGPTNDLTSDMIHARTDDGEPALTDDEIVANTRGFLGAGSDSSAVMILHTMYFLLTHPEQWDEVRADRSLVPLAIEETLRLRGPVRGLLRVATEEVDLGGVRLPKGARVYLHLASANNDDEVFEQPDRFDIHRPNVNEHLAFGKWAHFCIGAPLARLEGRVAIEALIDRVPNLRLAPDFDGQLAYADNHLLHLARSLPVEWD